MKKKVIIAVVLILMLTFTVGMLTGCDEIFKANNERDSHQIVASVNYGGQSANVLKFELVSSFNSYAPYYVNYYGMTYKQATEYVIKSLAQRELLVLFAKEYIAKQMKIDKVPSLILLKELLSDSEYNKAIKDTNKDLLSALESIVKGLIEENAYNVGVPEVPQEDIKVEVTDPVRVTFDADGGSAVEKQKIQKGTKAKEPTAPTKSGFTFYGWYLDEAVEEFKFDTTVSSSITLKAKWEEFTAPRTTKPVVEEVEDYDPEDIITEFAPMFFTDEYIKTIDFSDKDFAQDLKDKELKDFVGDGIAKLKKNLKDAYKSYDYFIDSQMKTLLITKLERVISEEATVTDAEVQSQFDRLVKENKETFEGSNTNYESALQKSLATTYFQKHTTDSYGFVVNILMKLDDDSVAILTKMMADGTVSKEAVKVRRDQLIKEMQIKVSNPDYDTTKKVDYGKDAEDKDIVVRDPMTDPNNPFNGIAGKDNASEYNKDNDYNNIIDFVYNAETKKFEIVYNVHEAPSMAYLIEEVPAFSKDDDIGIIEQIYNSYEKIKLAVTKGITDKDGEGSHTISGIESIYWLRQMANAWLYLVGDDAGSVSAENNNNGLGYLVSSKAGEKDGSSLGYIKDFTDHARKLFKNGTGAYTTAANSANEKERIDGSYVIGDSFIEKGDTTNAYAGIFVLLASNVVWDSSAKTFTKNDAGEIIGLENVVLDGKTGILPMDYIISYGETDKDCVTIGDQVKNNLLDGKKADRYNLVVNTFGVKNTGNIKYFAKIYKSLWENKK